jgi:LmbE family N-acetylglucosaminyl deacetylase
MTFHQARAELFIPDGIPVEGALARTTHLGIGAHPDDLEFMAYAGISECYAAADLHFGGITVTSGANPPKAGRYASLGPEEMACLRLEEQKQAARIGGYAFQACLGYSSSDLQKRSAPLHDDLTRILRAASPEVVYLHNPFDKHPTHVALLRRSLEVLRDLDTPPAQVWGCEVWRGLEWLGADDKHALVTGRHPALARELCGVFVSQNEGGKRYDLAVPARWQSNATFSDAHSTDTCSSLSWAVDLTPLIADRTRVVETFLREAVLRVLDEQMSKWISAV